MNLQVRFYQLRNPSVVYLTLEISLLQLVDSAAVGLEASGGYKIAGMYKTVVSSV